MTTNFTINHPDVRALLAETYRSSRQTYYQINPDGTCYIYPLRRKLVELGMNAKSATALIRQAAIPVTKFIKKIRPAPPETEPDAEAMVQAAMEVAAKEAAREEKRAKAAELEERANNRRYQLIETNSGKFGIWDNDSGTVISLYWTKEEAYEELVRLKAGNSLAGVYHYYGSRRSRQPDLMEVHY